MSASKSDKNGAKPPISAHRAFPAIVALWFAALFGLGSLVLPVALFESVVNTAGISSVISAAAPPLGATARIIIALVSGGIGAALGVFLARKVTAAHTPQPVRSRAANLDVAAVSDAPQNKRPISAREELGSDFLDDPVDTEGAPVAAGNYRQPQHRRALTMNDEARPSEYLDNVPLPGTDDGGAYPGFAGLAESNAELADDSGEEPLELSEFAHGPENDELEQQAAVPAFLASEPEPEPVHDFSAALNGEAEPFAMPEGFVAPATAHEILDDNTTSASGSQDINMTPQNDPADDATGEAMPFAAPQAVPAATPFGMPELSEEETPVAEAEIAPVEAVNDVAEEVLQAADPDTAALAELSLAQLVERFSRSLENRTQMAARFVPPMAEPTAESAPEPTSDSPPEPTPQPEAAEVSAVTQAAPFSIPQVSEIPEAEVAENANPVPSFMQPIRMDLDDEDGDDAEDIDAGLDALSLALTGAAPKPFARPVVPAQPAQVTASFEERIAAIADNAAEESGESDDDDFGGEDEAFSSLLAMKRPIAPGREFVRINDDSQPSSDDDAPEPVVVFPGHDERRAAPISNEPARAPVMANGAAAATAPQSDTRPFAPPSEIRPAPAHEKSQPGSDNEAALREALEKLQRLSGAG